MSNLLPFVLLYLPTHRSFKVIFNVFSYAAIKNSETSSNDGRAVRKWPRKKGCEIVKFALWLCLRKVQDSTLEVFVIKDAAMNVKKCSRGN